VPVAMSSEHAAFIVEYDLPSGFEVSLQELTVFLSKYGRHEYVH
jgi:hypothetical protein